jgi:uncharacterized MAPEG superfamily protein
MTTELIVLAWGCVLGIVHIWAAVRVKTRQYGAKWNVGPRDEELPPPNALVGRLSRAQANYFETFPIMAAAILLISAAGLNTDWTAAGAVGWLAARIVYLPLYGFGVPVARTLAFTVSMVGIVMVLWTALAATFP